MKCTAHPGTPAEASCSLCKVAGCARCLAYDVDGAATCATCGEDEEARSRAVGSALLAAVAAGYLVALAIGYLVLRDRPVIGGVAVVAAIAFGRILQLYVHPRDVTRRQS